MAISHGSAAIWQGLRLFVSRHVRRDERKSDSARDLDVEQAWLRVGIGSVAFSYAWFLVLSEGFLSSGLIASVIASGTAALVGAWMVRRLKRSKEHIVSMRFLAISTDMAAITIAMAGADEGGVPFVGFYLWVTVGNGFRYGPRYLLAAYWLSLLGYAYLLLFVPFWIQHRAFSLGLLVILGVVPLYVLVLLTRLTAQKEAAEQLSNAKSRFVANVSHELRTPLTGVSAVYDLLRARKLTAEDRELVGMLGNAVTTLRTSVDAVLLMSKLEAGAEAAEDSPFNLWYFLQQLAALVRPQSIAKGLAWNLEIDSTVPSTVLGDQGHLGHVLGNLLNNAFKFTKTGSVTLRVRGIEGIKVRFEVIDTGIGISHEHQERLFERFVQVENSSTRRFGGTGLGTSIARDLAELMGGQIGVTSAPGQGSTFWVELPMRQAVEMQLHSEWGTQREILIAGRNDSLNQDVSKVLGELKFESIAMSEASSIERILDAQRYLATLVIMEAGEAVSYVESALRDRAGISTPFIIVTRSVSGSQRDALVKRGVSGILETPLVPLELCTALSALQNRLDPHRTVPANNDALFHSAFRSLNILLADDNRSNTFLLSHILKDAGHRVETAQSGGMAFDLLASGDFDMAILDLNMPDMSGPDVVKLYRASAIGTSKVPVIILSADATAGAKRESLEAGADEFLTKPITAPSLLAAIDRISGGISARGESGREKTSEGPVGERVLTNRALVDPERLHSLRRIARNDERFLERYIAAAFSELEAAISELRAAIPSMNSRAIQDCLHIIEGTGGSIGALALVSNCKTMRDELGPDNMPDRDRALAELSTTYALTKSTVLSSLHLARDFESRDRTSRQ